MAKKSRRRPARRSSSSTRRAGKPSGRAASLSAHQDQALGSLIAFVGWHREHGILPELAVLEQLNAFLPVYAEISGGAPVTAMDPRLIAEWVKVLNERDADLAAFVCFCLFEYMHFLRHTGRWTGSEERHRVLHSVLYRGALGENDPP
ncbi:hypothetical protein [Arthrobacter sp. EPSL27]|uniref:hypothetical protein n=1 Tax=Arthrobacter sp. EPSL27 TaxID=1745378 RepID=UPI0012F93180|nr:hypothetical protein [Arthrobacter sp. EPSL27]